MDELPLVIPVYWYLWLMKLKVKYLIGGCVLAILALTAIQGYFIYNTFILKQREAETAVRAELIKMEEHIHIDQLRNAWFKQMDSLVRENRQSEINVLTSHGSAAISKQVSDYINHNQILNQYHTAYEVVIQNAILFNEHSGYELVLKNKPWFNNGKRLNQPQIIHDLTASDDASARPVVLDFNTRSSFSINDWQQGILRQMIGLLVFSALLLAFVILLFYFSIRAIITQKKITDMQTDFINNITHEFNTPLATLSVAVSTVKSQSELNTNHILSNSIQVIERQHIRLKKLIDQVMTHTAGPQQLLLKKEMVPMEHFLQEIITDFKAANSEVEIIERLQCDPVSIAIDQFHLTTAIGNMLENAVKYGGTQLIMMTTLEDTCYQIAILDNGIGIAKEELEHIFGKFYRVEKGDIHTVKGLGLGLFYSQQVVTAHGGHIGVQSIYGKGTTFTITLPLT